MSIWYITRSHLFNFLLKNCSLLNLHYSRQYWIATWSHQYSNTCSATIFEVNLNPYTPITTSIFTSKYRNLSFPSPARRVRRPNNIISSLSYFLIHTRQSTCLKHAYLTKQKYLILLINTILNYILLIKYLFHYFICSWHFIICLISSL